MTGSMIGSMTGPWRRQLPWALLCLTTCRSGSPDRREGTVHSPSGTATPAAKPAPTVLPAATDVPAVASGSDAPPVGGLAAPKILWVTDGFHFVFGSPNHVANGVVFAEDHHAKQIAGLDLASGSVRWRSAAALGVMDGDTVLVHTAEEVRALALEDGRTLWKHRYACSDPWGWRAGHGLAVAACGLRKASLIVLDLNNGAQRLRAPLAGGGFTPLAMDERRVYLEEYRETGSWIVVCDVRTGKVLWEAPMPPRMNSPKAHVRDGRLFLYVNTTPGLAVLAHDAETGKPLWQHHSKAAGLIGPLTFFEGLLALPGNGGLDGLDPATGLPRRRWEFPPAVPATHWSPEIVADDRRIMATVVNHAERWGRLVVWDAPQPRVLEMPSSCLRPQLAGDTLVVDCREQLRAYSVAETVAAGTRPSSAAQLPRGRSACCCAQTDAGDTLGVVDRVTCNGQFGGCIADLRCADLGFRGGDSPIEATGFRAPVRVAMRTQPSNRKDYSEMWITVEGVGGPPLGLLLAEDLPPNMRGPIPPEPSEERGRRMLFRVEDVFGFGCHVVQVGNLIRVVHGGIAASNDGAIAFRLADGIAAEAILGPP